MSRPHRALWWLIAVPAVSALVFMLFEGAPRSRGVAAAFLSSEEYKVWRTLVVGFTAIGVAVVPAVWDLYRRVCHEQRVVSKHGGQSFQVRLLWLGFAALLAAACSMQWVTARPGPLAGWPWRTTSLVAVGMLIVAPALVGIWLVAIVLGRVRDIIKAFERPQNGRVSWGGRQTEVLTQLRRIPTLLQRLLVTLSAAVSAVTLSTGALRLAVLTVQPKPPWPPADPLVFGGLFAVLLALSYLPGAVRLQDSRRMFVDAVSPIPRRRPDNDWYEDRERIQKLVIMEDSGNEGVQAAIAIVAPIVASLAAVLLPDK
jgi:hypothetical protein